jgi:hypothetical protein
MHYDTADTDRLNLLAKSWQLEEKTNIRSVAPFGSYLWLSQRAYSASRRSMLLIFSRFYEKT